MTPADRRTGKPADRSLKKVRNPPEGSGGFNVSDRPPVRLADLPVTFVGTFPDPAVQLDPPLPEIGFVGRSNVGKSSLINALFARPGLARVSGTPGKTRALNVFRLPQFYAVDLPGYGYAKADKQTRADIHAILAGYLVKRERIAGVVWLLDIRREPSSDDLRMLDEFAAEEHPVLAVLTKADKLGRSQQVTRGRDLARSLGLPDAQVLITSSQTGAGIAELGESILSLVAPLSRRKPSRS
jgi:GTP-binding protein